MKTNTQFKMFLSVVSTLLVMATCGQLHAGPSSPGTVAAQQLIAAGLINLSRQTTVGLQGADIEFADALLADPTNDVTNQEAGVLKALTGIALLQSQPPFQDLLGALGIQNTGSGTDIYQASYSAIDGTNGHWSAPGGANSNMILAYLNSSSVQSALTNGIKNLKNATSQSISITLTGTQSGLSLARPPVASITLDYGDVQTLLSFLYTAQALINFGNTYNASVAFVEAQNLFSLMSSSGVVADNNGPPLNEALFKEIPSFLTFTGTASDQRPQALAALILANNAYQNGSNYMRTSRPKGSTVNHLFGIANPAKEYNLCSHLYTLAYSLKYGSTTLKSSTNTYTIDLNQLILSKKSPRSLLGTFDWDHVVQSTWPDSTLGGILPGQTQSTLNNLAFKTKVLQRAIYTPYVFTTLEPSANLNSYIFAQSITSSGDGGVYFINADGFSLMKLSSADTMSTIVEELPIYPSGITTSASGAKIYVIGRGGETSALTVLEITSGGSTSTFFTSGEINYSAGQVNGTGTAATFDTPISPIVDASGNLYLIDDNAIRKITPGGVVSTVAGKLGLNGTGSGYANGSGASARFNFPNALAMDKSGNIYVADANPDGSYSTQGNAVIREIAAGTDSVSTYAGEPQDYKDYDTSPPTSALFGNITAMTIDSAGNLYVACDNSIRRISTSGSVTTLGGSTDNNTGNDQDGMGVMAQFSTPSGLAVAPNGVLFVQDNNYNNSDFRIVTGTAATSGSIILGNLATNYDGTPKPAVAITNPNDLGVTITYNGSTTPPVVPGTYAVVATVSGTSYPGLATTQFLGTAYPASASGTLILSKGFNNITFDTVSTTLITGTTFALTAAASSGLPVSYASSNPGVVTVSGSTATIKTTGVTVITASQAGNADYKPATSVLRNLIVTSGTTTSYTITPHGG